MGLFKLLHFCEKCGNTLKLEDVLNNYGDTRAFCNKCREFFIVNIGGRLNESSES